MNVIRSTQIDILLIQISKDVLSPNESTLFNL